MKHLTIGTSVNGKPFTLPLDYVTRSVACLAQKRVGKSYTAAVIAEELLDSGQLPVIIDYTGAHWGLKSAADGKRAGYEIVIFGGDHADIPIRESSGEVIAMAIVQQRFAAIIDLTSFRKGEAVRFLGAFFETLYRLNRKPLHLICDEADAYAPQKPMGDEARVLGAMDDIVRRGGIRGLGCTLITQRPAVISKNVLTQCEMLIALRLMHPIDIKVIEEWVAVHADPAQMKIMKADLPTLPKGTAWVWSPSMGNVFEKVKIRTRKTFDSGKTPETGDNVHATVFAKIDISQLGKAISETAIQLAANDPKVLRREIAELKAKLAAGNAPAQKERVEVPVFSEHEVERLKKLEAIGEAFVAEVEAQATNIRDFVSEVRTLRAEITHRLSRVTISISPPSLIPTKVVAAVVEKHVAARSSSSAPKPGEPMAKAERAILTALVQFGACTKPRLAALTGYSVNGGGFNNALSSLRNKLIGPYINTGEPIMHTHEGYAALGSYEPLPTGQDLRNQWLGRLDKAQRSIMEVLFRAHPTAMGKEMLAVEAGYEVSGGGFNNALSALRTLELITRGSEIKASDNLFV
jgi:uncharacterized protein